MSNAKPSLPERLFGFFLVAAAIAVIAVATIQFVADTKRINNAAKVARITQVAPLKDGWQLEMPNPMKDPRSIQSWDYADAQASFAAQSKKPATQMMSPTQALILVKGTDGKKETQALALVDVARGTAVWTKTWDDLPLDYCLPQMWLGNAVCESHTAKKVVRIAADGNITTADLPQNIWDLATGPHVLGTVFDQFLVVSLAVSEGSSAGTEAFFVNPDFTYKGRYRVLVPNASAAQPLNVQTSGAITLVGTVSAAADGANRVHTWAYSKNINVSSTHLDTAALGAAAQVSLLEAGFFGSSDPEDTATDTTKWQVYSAEGAVKASGQAPRVAVQAMHTQLRSGLSLDVNGAASAIQSGKIPSIIANRKYLLTEISESCQDWTGCENKAWETADGISLQLKQPARPLLANDTVTVFMDAEGALQGYGLADGKYLWEGVVPPDKTVATSSSPVSLAGGVAQLRQIGQLAEGEAKAVLEYWNLP